MYSQSFSQAQACGSQQTYLHFYKINEKNVNILYGAEEYNLLLYTILYSVVSLEFIIYIWWINTHTSLMKHSVCIYAHIHRDISP